jgi:hypothetical protein
MSNPVSRARAHFPQIQITMVSIIVALALQQWLDRLPTIDAMWELTQVAVRIWCQALVAFVIIAKMWSGFVLAGVVNERVPTAVDMLGPLGILIFVDAQIASIGVDHALRWWLVLGAGSLLAAAFIAGQRVVNPDVTREQVESESTSGRSAIGRRIGTSHPATFEVALGVVALLIAAVHWTVGLGEFGLLAASALFLLGEALSATGAIMGWRILRKIEARQRPS